MCSGFTQIPTAGGIYKAQIVWKGACGGFYKFGFFMACATHGQKIYANFYK